LVFTIGYESTTQADFVAALQQAGVAQVIDVRALPLSRRPGFSKTPLRLALAGEGIGYIHLRALGTPPAGREAARKGRTAELERIYADQLALPEALAAAAQLDELVRARPSALLCFERQPEGCHRSMLIREALPEVRVVHLFA
jgi:uncharacterized protein (DUF488 family)